MGGLSGHMMHPHDNLNLSIKDFRTLCNKSVYGETRFSEKIDGFNIHILNHNGRMRFARNGRDLDGCGFGRTEIDDRFCNDKVRDIYKRAWDLAALNIPVDMIPLFEEDLITFNCEVIISGQTNIMPYRENRVIVHNAFRWEKADGKYRVAEVIPVRALPEATAPEAIYNTPAYLDRSYVDHKVNEVFGAYRMSDDQTIGDYYRYRFVQVIASHFGEYLAEPEVLKYVFNRFFKVGEQINLRKLRQMTTQNLQPLLDYQKDIIYVVKAELDKLVLHFGTIILEHTTGINKAFAPVAAGVLAGMVAETDKDFKFNERWGACDNKVFGLEGVVVTFKDDIYKWTGPFAPINQLLGGR